VPPHDAKNPLCPRSVRASGQVGLQLSTRTRGLSKGSLTVHTAPPTRSIQTMRVPLSLPTTFQPYCLMHRTLVSACQHTCTLIPFLPPHSWAWASPA